MQTVSKIRLQKRNKAKRLVHNLCMEKCFSENGWTKKTKQKTSKKSIVKYYNNLSEVLLKITNGARE